MASAGDDRDASRAGMQRAISSRERGELRRRAPRRAASPASAAPAGAPRATAGRRCRGRAARPQGRAGVLCRRSACDTAATSGGMSARIGVCAHCRANSSIVIDSIRSARRSSARRRCSRSASSASPGLAPISTRRVTRCGSASATCSAIRPPWEYPTSVNGSGCQRCDVVDHRARASRARRARRGMAADVRSDRTVPLAEPRDHRLPTGAAVGEAVQQHECGCILHTRIMTANGHRQLPGDPRTAR